MGRARPFDDLYSWLHFLAAVYATITGVEVAATLVFIAYQWWEREKRPYKLGDFIEWLAGLLVGALARLLLA